MSFKPKFGIFFVEKGDTFYRHSKKVFPIINQTSDSYETLIDEHVTLWFYQKNYKVNLNYEIYCFPLTNKKQVQFWKKKLK